MHNESEKIAGRSATPSESEPAEVRDSRNSAAEPGEGRISRRSLLRAGALGAAGLAVAQGARALRADQQYTQTDGGPLSMKGHESHGANAAVGNLQPGGFDPMVYLKRFETGRVSMLPNGQTLREFELVAVDREIEIAPGVFFPAWTYNGEVPGPTIRVTEGDRVRVNFVNAGSHPHTIHFHGIHASNMDGVFEVVDPGRSFVYEFDAEPFGLQLYHCHAIPLKRHIHKGLYGVFIIDPKAGREPANEMVMVMNAFDTNFDGDNEVYAVNTVGFHYQTHPIPLELGKLNRIYLVNLTEFDLINSFHLHGNFFRYYRTGTDLERYESTDNIMLCQGERGIVEFTFKFPGRFMFHAHQSEFAELGWMGMFDVKEALHA